MYERHEDPIDHLEMDCYDLVDMTTSSMNWSVYAWRLILFRVYMITSSNGRTITKNYWGHTKF